MNKHLLDIMTSIPFSTREIYGHDFNNKPNEHCNWVNLGGVKVDVWVWQENDEHFRSRIRGIINE